MGGEGGGARHPEKAEALGDFHPPQTRRVGRSLPYDAWFSDTESRPVCGMSRTTWATCGRGCEKKETR